MLSCWELLRAQTHWKGIIICDCPRTSCYEILEMKLFPIIMPSRHGTYYLSVCSETLVSNDWPLRTAKKTHKRYNSQLNLQTNKQMKDRKKSMKRESYKYKGLMLFVLRGSRKEPSYSHPRFRAPCISLLWK